MAQINEIICVWNIKKTLICKKNVGNSFFLRKFVS